MEAPKRQAFKQILAGLQKNLTCPLCRQLMEDPHSFNPGCGHYFCLVCVRGTMEGPGITASQCPICHHPGWKKDLKPAYQLRSVIERYCELEALISSQGAHPQTSPAAPAPLPQVYPSAGLLASAPLPPTLPQANTDVVAGTCASRAAALHSSGPLPATEPLPTQPIVSAEPPATTQPLTTQLHTSHVPQQAECMARSGGGSTGAEAAGSVRTVNAAAASFASRSGNSLGPTLDLPPAVEAWVSQQMQNNLAWLLSPIPSEEDQEAAVQAILPMLEGERSVSKMEQQLRAMWALHADLEAHQIPESATDSGRVASFHGMADLTVVNTAPTVCVSAVLTACTTAAATAGTASVQQAAQLSVPGATHCPEQPEPAAPSLALSIGEAANALETAASAMVSASAERGLASGAGVGVLPDEAPREQGMEVGECIQGVQKQVSGCDMQVIVLPAQQPTSTTAAACAFGPADERVDAADEREQQQHDGCIDQGNQQQQQQQQRRKSKAADCTGQQVGVDCALEGAEVAVVNSGRSSSPLPARKRRAPQRRGNGAAAKRARPKQAAQAKEKPLGRAATGRRKQAEQMLPVQSVVLLPLSEQPAVPPAALPSTTGLSGAGLANNGPDEQAASGQQALVPNPDAAIRLPDNSSGGQHAAEAEAAAPGSCGPGDAAEPPVRGDGGGGDQCQQPEPSAGKRGKGKRGLQAMQVAGDSVSDGSGLAANAGQGAQKVQAANKRRAPPTTKPARSTVRGTTPPADGGHVQGTTRRTPPVSKAMNEDIMGAVHAGQQGGNSTSVADLLRVALDKGSAPATEPAEAKAAERDNPAPTPLHGVPSGSAVPAQATSTRLMCTTSGGNVVNSQTFGQRPVHLCLVAVEGPIRAQLASYCKRTPNAAISQDVTREVTHSVVQCDHAGRAVKRTLRYLEALLCGCHVVRDAWAVESMRVGEWLDEADYMVKGDPYTQGSAAAAGLPELALVGGPARARQRRLDGQGCHLFEGVRFHLVASSVPDPTKRDGLLHLLQLGGAQQVHRPVRSPAPAVAGAAGAPAADQDGLPPLLAAALRRRRAAGKGATGAGRQAVAAQQAAGQAGADGVSGNAELAPLVLLVGEGARAEERAQLQERWGVSPTRIDWVKDSVTHFQVLPLKLYQDAT